MALRFKVYLFLILTAFVIGAIKFLKLSAQLKAVVVLLGITFSSEVIGRVLAYKIRNSNPAYHFYTPFECLLLMVIFYFLTVSIKLKKIIVIAFLFLICFSLFNSFFLQGLYEFNSNIDILKMPVVFCIAALIAFDKINLPYDDSRRIIDSDILIIGAILWFNMAGFAFFLSYNYFLTNNVDKRMLGNIHYITNMIYYTLLLLALLIYPVKVNNVKC